MAKTYTFYVNSDNIQTKSKDKARIKKVMDAFKSIGHKAVNCGVGSDIHSKPKKFGCTGKNEVWVCIFGGVCGGTIADQTGYQGFGSWFKNDQLKKAHLFYIFMNSPEGRASNLNTISKLPRAWDDNFSPKSFKGIPNPKTYLQKNGVTWIQGGTTAEIVNLIKTQNFQGSGFEDLGQSNVQTTTTKHEITHGFDEQKPFEAYLRVDYSIGSRDGEEKHILIDWQSEAQGTDEKKFSNDSAPQWKANNRYVWEVDLLSKIKSAEGDYPQTGDTKYYLKRVTFLRDFKDVLDDKDTEEKENLLYDSTKDKSSYKMLLYDLGVFNGEVINPINLGVNGKTILDGVKSILEKSEYEFQIKYGEYRKDDYINFTQHTNSEENIAHIFNEGFDGDIIGISNVKYSPTKDLVNDCLTVYKSLDVEDYTGTHYRYTRKGKLGEILRYGEQTHIENMQKNSSYSEATQYSHDALQKYFKPLTTFTVKAVGLPPVGINDWVETKTINPLLTNTYQVASRKINIDVTDRPMVQTEYGLGDIDANMKVKNNLAQQRKKLVREPLDLSETVMYNDKMTEEAIDNVWVDNV